MKQEGMRQHGGQWVRFIGFIISKLWSKRPTRKKNNNYWLRTLFFSGVLGLINFSAYAGKPVFLIKAITKAPAVLYLGETATANYLVTNNTPYPLKNNGLSQLPTGISQSGGSCHAPFELAPGQSCNIQLSIIADRLSGDVHGGPTVCNTINNPVYCARPTSQDGLEIKKINTPPPTNPPSVPQNIIAKINIAVDGSLSARITWDPPKSDGGLPLVSYLVTANSSLLAAAGSCSTDAAHRNCTINGLNPGTKYVFSVAAINSSGKGLPAPSPPVITPTAPYAPTAVAAVANSNGTVDINWTAPNDGNSAITGYTVSSSPDNVTCSTSGATNCTYSTLIPGSSYSFTVKATNVIGVSPASAPSNMVHIPAVPGAPTSVIATVSGDGAGTISVTVNWVAPVHDGGTGISGYTVTPSPLPSTGSTTCTTTGVTSCTFTNLTQGSTYSFVVTAQNSMGDGIPSNASNTIRVQDSQTISFISSTPTDAVVNGSSYSPSAATSSGLAVSFSVDSASTGICFLSGGLLSYQAVGNCILNANQTGNNYYIAAPQVQQNISVGKGSQTISYTSTAPSNAVVAGPTYTPTAIANSGLTVTLSVDASSSTVCSMSAGVVSFIGAGTCTLNANQGGDSNYNAAPQLQQNFTVGQGSQSISYTSPAPTGAVVAGAPYTPTATATSGLAVTFTVDATSSAVCSINAGVVSFIGIGTCTLNANQNGDSNYNAAPQLQQNFTVGQGSQSISYTSPEPTGAVVAGAPYTPTATATSGLAVTFTVDATSSTICSMNAGVVSFIGAGTCTLNANQNGDSNYTAAPQVQQIFTVGKGNQSISYTSPAPTGAVVAGTPYTPTATAASGLAVTFTVDATSSAVCSINAGVVSFIGIGTCTLNANQGGDSNYNAAPQLQQNFTVGQGSQSISYTSTEPSGAVVAGAPYTPTATATSGLAVTFTVDATSSTICSMNAGVVSFIGAGTCTLNANQNGDSNYTAAPQVQQIFTVGKGNQSISYTSTAPSLALVGGTTYTPTATASSELTVAITVDVGSSSVCSISGGVVSFNGVGTCTINANQSGDSNYHAATQMQQSFSVITTPGAPTTVTAVAGNGLALVSWAAPSSTGGSSISSYQVTSSPGGFTCNTSGLARCKITGLSNGTSYTFTVTATNSAGTGPTSLASNAVAPIPDPTTTQLYSSLNPAAVGDSVTVGAQVTSVNGFLTVGTVSFFNGGVAISGCSGITVVSGYASCSTSFASAATNTITATYNGTTANSASTSAGFNQYSVASISQVTLTTSPRQVTAIPGDGQVVIRWLPPFNTGGQAITGYTVTYGPTTASPTSSSYQTVGCSTSGNLSCTVTGLTNGTAYTFRVFAVNSSGNGIPSYSSSVKPGSAMLVSPSTLALSGLGSGIYRAFTLTNTNLFPVTITQTPASSDFSPALPTGTTLYTTTCTIDTVLNPGDSCSVTLKPGSVASAMSSPNTASACTANVAGRTAPAANVIQVQTDAGAISAQVLVLGYGCTYQSGYVFSIDDTVANTLSIAGKVAATGDQGSNKIWASNGAGSAPAQVSLDLIPGIDYTSTGGTASPTGAAFVSFFSSYYMNANPFATASFIACEGKMDGQCNTYNILLYYNQLITNYNNAGSPKYTASAGPTNTSYYATGLCSTTISNYNDWYLPAICEMGYDQSGVGTGCGSSGAPFMQNIQSNLIKYNSLNLLNAFSASYYSSSEYATVSSNNPRQQACGQQFDLDDTYVAQSPFTKNNQAQVRCVRLFTH
ncbi:fibronectin type III domain-containing protein [Legionella lytica]|uniref:Fibronectin type III domain-containing protein n=1 Tax=Legionella lytica TaxID=96232 RepID=A0ABW8DAY3_9GAMM